MILKTYELSLDPEKLSEFFETWDEASAASTNDLAGFDAHLGKAKNVLDRLAVAKQNESAAEIFGPGLEAFISLNSTFLFKSDAWDILFPNSTTLLDTLTSYQKMDVEKALSALATVHDGASRLVLCKEEDDQSDSLILIQKVGAPSVGRFYVRWLRSAWSPDLQRYFSENHELTDAELLVFEKIVNGVEFSNIAKQLNKSKETVRTQSKSIYAKLGLKNREDAVRLALHIQLLLPSTRSVAVAKFAKLENETLNVDGTKICVVRKGMLSGNPFIFLHGMVSGYELGESFEENLRRANLCAICIERPGYGRSDDPTSINTILDEWLAKFPLILKALGIETCSLVSQASGVAYVAATINRYPELTPRGLGISAGIPDFSGNARKRQPVSYRFLNWCLGRSPSALSFYFKVHAAYLNQSNKYDTLVLNNHAACEPDKNTLQDEATLRCVVTGYKLAFWSNQSGFTGDLIATWKDGGRWRKILDEENPTGHLHHVWGTESDILDIEECKAYCDTYPFTSWSTLEGGGHFIQFTHAEQIVNRIAKMVHNEDSWCKN